jgi:hypothetical protein
MGFAGLYAAPKMRNCQKRKTFCKQKLNASLALAPCKNDSRAGIFFLKTPIYEKLTRKKEFCNSTFHKSCVISKNTCKGGLQSQPTKTRSLGVIKPLGMHFFLLLHKKNCPGE